MRTVESIVNEARQRLVCAKDWDEKSYEGTEVARLKVGGPHTVAPQQFDDLLNLPNASIPGEVTYTMHMDSSWPSPESVYARKYSDAESRAAFTLLDSLWQRCLGCQFKTWIEDLTLDTRLCMGCHREREFLADLTSQNVSPF